MFALEWTRACGTLVAVVLDRSVAVGHAFRRSDCFTAGIAASAAKVLTLAMVFFCDKRFVMDGPGLLKH